MVFDALAKKALPNPQGGWLWERAFGPIKAETSAWKFRETTGLLNVSHLYPTASLIFIVFFLVNIRLGVSVWSRVVQKRDTWKTSVNPLPHTIFAKYKTDFCIQSNTEMVLGRTQVEAPAGIYVSPYSVGDMLRIQLNPTSSNRERR